MIGNYPRNTPEKKLFPHATNSLYYFQPLKIIFPPKFFYLPPKSLTASFWTPLHEAVNEGNIACVELLLTSGAQINIQDIDGNTPLHKSAENLDLEATSILLKYGAVLSIKNEIGMSPR
jgi:ankyrin repeat protein